MVASCMSLAPSVPCGHYVKGGSEDPADTQSGGMQMFGRATHKREEKVTLPDGRQISLDRDFSEYTIEELAALGITPGQGGAATAKLIPRGLPGARVSARAAIVGAVLSGLLVGIAVALWRVPMSGVDTQPPECFATFGNSVPCGSGPGAFALAAAAALIAGTLTYFAVRRMASGRPRWKPTGE